MAAILEKCSPSLIDCLPNKPLVKLAPGALAKMILEKQITLAVKFLAAGKASVLETHVISVMNGSNCFGEFWDYIPEDITGHEVVVLGLAIRHQKQQFIEKAMEAMNALNSAIDPQDSDLAWALGKAIQSGQLEIADRILSSAVAVKDCNRSKIYDQARQLHEAIICLRNEVSKLFSEGVVDLGDPQAMALAIHKRSEYCLPYAAPAKKEAYRTAALVVSAFEGNIILSIQEEYCRSFKGPPPANIEDTIKAISRNEYHKMLRKAFFYINIHELNSHGENLLQRALKRGLINLARELLELENIYYETSKVASRFLVDFDLVIESLESLGTVKDIANFIKSCIGRGLGMYSAVHKVKWICELSERGEPLSSSVIDGVYKTLKHLFRLEYRSYNFVDLLVEAFVKIKNIEVASALTRIRDQVCKDAFMD
ncbi:MAG: hypothetical protein KDK50_06945, partial [Chlamydiia bacterium]|nr:hypothetical protein [Chlamydiia bacterium]